MKRLFLGVFVKVHNLREKRVLDIMEARMKYLAGPSGAQVFREIQEDVSVLYYLQMIDYEDVDVMVSNLERICQKKERTVNPASMIYKIG